MIISFGWKASLVTGFNVNHRYRNADPADLPPGVTADHPAALRSISWVGAPFWAMRRAMPTRPLWPLIRNRPKSSGGPVCPRGYTGGRQTYAG